MTRNQVIIACIVALCALALSETEERVSQQWFDRCLDIGKSTGCSGCNDPRRDCDWCVQSTDDRVGICAPTGQCGALTLPDDPNAFFIEKNGLCASVLKEPHLSATKGDVIRGSSVWSQHHDPHYCEFPTAPWPVDRTANYFGVADPATVCIATNEQLIMGQRGDIETSCVVNLDSPRSQACLRKVQSLLCSESCPTYGKGERFNKLCYDDYAAIEQTCGLPLLTCLLDRARRTISHADKGDTDCSSPDYIKVSYKFDYDYCFFGDLNRCYSNRDCLLSTATVNPFTSLAGLGTCTIPTDPGVAGPCCYAMAYYNTIWTSIAMYEYEVVVPALGDGKACSNVASDIALSLWPTGGAETHRTQTWCTDTKCVVALYTEICNGCGQPSGYPTFCKGGTGSPKCPAASFSCLTGLPEQAFLS